MIGWSLPGVNYYKVIETVHLQPLKGVDVCPQGSVLKCDLAYMCYIYIDRPPKLYTVYSGSLHRDASFLYRHFLSLEHLSLSQWNQLLDGMDYGHRSK